MNLSAQQTNSQYAADQMLPFWGYVIRIICIAFSSAGFAAPLSYTQYFNSRIGYIQRSNDTHVCKSNKSEQ